MTTNRVLVGTVATCAAAGLMTFLALWNVPGAVQVSGTNYDTEFVNSQWVTASLLLAVPIFFVARRSRLLAAVAVLVAGILQFVIADVTVERYGASGWSDGLEGLAYVYAFFVAFLFVGSAFVGWASTRRARSRAVAR